MSPKSKLAMTVALEHLTSIGAASALSDPRVFAVAQPKMARLWHWHAIEETEHKVVAFDVYREVAGTGLLAWLRRSAALLLVSASMQATVWIVLARVTFRKGQMLDLSGWMRLFGFLWIRPGVLRREIPRYFRFFMPGFHPWDIDNYADVESFQRAYGKDASWSAVVEPDRRTAS